MVDAKKTVFVALALVLAAVAVWYLADDLIYRLNKKDEAISLCESQLEDKSSELVASLASSEKANRDKTVAEAAGKACETVLGNSTKELSEKSNILDFARTNLTACQTAKSACIAEKESLAGKVSVLEFNLTTVDREKDLDCKIKLSDYVLNNTYSVREIASLKTSLNETNYSYNTLVNDSAYFLCCADYPNTTKYYSLALNHVTCSNTTGTALQC